MLKKLAATAAFTMVLAVTGQGEPSQSIGVLHR